MTPFTGFLAGVALMLVADGAFCLLLPRLIREAYMRRAQAEDAQTRARGWWLVSAGVFCLLTLGFL